MVFGILDDYKLQSIPGTGLLSEKLESHLSATNESRGLKRAAGKYSHIVLIPQPSDDPRDPYVVLNWPRWKKETCFWTLVFASGVSLSTLAPAGSAFGLLSKEFNLSVDEVASSFSANFLGIAAFVGIAVAMLINGMFNDWGIIRMSQRNRGIYEPEFRLVFMHRLLFGIFGYVGWAVGNDHGMPWIGAVACNAMLNLSLVISNGTAIAYLIDTHGARAADVVALMNCAQGVILYAATFFANGVVLARGVKVSLLILGSCQAVCWLAAVLMYVYGKRVRSFIARHPRLFRRDLPRFDPPQSAPGSKSESKR